MKYLTCFLIIIYLFIFNPYCWADESLHKNDVIVLCYHDITKYEPNDNYFSVSQKKFMQQLEYLKTNGFHFVSLQDIIDAKIGKKDLPSRAVFLSFDDGYKSYYDFVYPVLTRLGYPSMLAVAGAWIDSTPPEDLPSKLMSWKEIAEVDRNSLVEVVSHSYDLHKAVPYNPAGNVAAAATSRLYLAKEHRYENENEYRTRIKKDFQKEQTLFQKFLGRNPRAIAWPFGRYNAIGVEIARQFNIPVTFNLDANYLGRGIDLPLGINRIIVDDWNIDVFTYMVNTPKLDLPPIRAAQIDLDLIYDQNSSDKTEQNLGKLIDRLVGLGVNTVFLQAFSDDEGSGNIKSVYFDNRVLPVKADIFSHAAHQLSIRGIAVYAWLPTLSIIFPDKNFNIKNRVTEYKNGEVTQSSSWYERLTPFSEDVQNKVNILYEDLAINAQIKGILFQDDAYLNDFEDMHHLALQSFAKELGYSISPSEILNNQDIQQKWTKFKTKKLVDFTKKLENSVKIYRPETSFARNIYANLILLPNSEEWFAQNFSDYINNYDFTVIMAYPQMENCDNPIEWLKKLAQISLDNPESYKKVIFKVQSFDWKNKNWINDELFLREIRTILSSGIRNIAYYPDTYIDNKPSLERAKLEFSSKTLPQ